MSRPLRIEYPGAWYHVMNRGRRREKIFKDVKDYAEYLDLLGKCFALFELEIHAFSLMPNHYHLLVRTPRGNLARAMRHLNGVYTQKFNKRHNLEGSVFRGRYKSILVEEDSYLTQLVRYIHQNPLKAGLEKQVGLHRWTSHGYYLKKQGRPDWLQRKYVLRYFGKREKEAMKRFDCFVKEDVDEDLQERLAGKNWPAILGGEKFKEFVKDKYLGKQLEDKEIAQGRDLLREKKISDIKKWATVAWGIEKSTWQKIRRGYEQPQRRAMIYVSRWNLKATSKEISEEFGGVGHTAISKQCRLGADEVKQKSGCYRYVRELQKYIKCQV